MTPAKKTTRKPARRAPAQAPELARRAPVQTPEPARKDHVDELFARLDELQKQANVNAVFGPPVRVGEKTIIPIASVTYAFGLGFDEEQEQEEKESEAAGGAGAIAWPLGVAEITPERTRIEPVVNEQIVVLAGLLLAAWSVFWVARAVIRILRH